MPAAVLLADRDQLFLTAIGAAIDDEPDLQVVACAVDGWSAARLATEFCPDVVVLDSELPERSGIDTCTALRDDGVTAPILILSQVAHAETLMRAVQAGANGYAGKDSTLTELIGVVRTVAYDGAWVPPAMLGTLLRGLINQRREEDFVVSRFHTLTRRERDVLALITEGRTDHEIGDALYISPQTARTHAHKVLRKLDVHSRLEASILAVDYRLIERIDTQREGT